MFTYRDLYPNFGRMHTTRERTIPDEAEELLAKPVGVKPSILWVMVLLVVGIVVIGYFQRE